MKSYELYYIIQNFEKFKMNSDST